MMSYSLHPRKEFYSIADGIANTWQVWCNAASFFLWEECVESTRGMQRNLHLLFWGRAFLEIKVLAAVLVLFYRSRGLTMEQIFHLTIVWSVTALVCEVPSGYMADVIGRKKTILIGTALFLFSQVDRVYATTYPEFAFQFVLLSASHACFSGTKEALLYESLKALGREDEMMLQHGRLSSANQIFKIVGPIIGAVVAKDLTETQYTILLWTDAAVACMAFLLFLFLTEPPHVKQVLEEEVGIFTESLQTLKANAWMMRVSLFKILVFTGAFCAWRVYQPILAEHGVSAIWLGAFYAFTSIIGFLGTWFLGWIGKRIGMTVFVTGMTILSIAMYLISILSSNPVAMYVAFLVIISCSIFLEPAFSQMVNAHVQSKSRATTLSHLNMLKSIVDIPLIFLAASISMLDLRLPLVLGYILCRVALFILPTSRTEREHPSTP